MHAAVEAILRADVPMLLVRGQVSDLVNRERAEEFLARFPQVEFTDVRGAGHMVAGDRNESSPRQCWTSWPGTSTPDDGLVGHTERLYDSVCRI